MSLYLDDLSYENLGSFLISWREDLVEQCKKAMEYAGIYQQTQYEDYVVLTNIEGYFCIARITNEWTPLEISDEVYPFDKERIYPMQRIEKVYQFKRF